MPNIYYGFILAQSSCGDGLNNVKRLCFKITIDKTNTIFRDSETFTSILLPPELDGDDSLYRGESDDLLVGGAGDDIVKIKSVNMNRLQKYYAANSKFYIEKKCA